MNDAAAGEPADGAGPAIGIRVINLARAAARRRFMTEQLAALGLAGRFFAAVEAATIAPEVGRSLNRRWERPLSDPELGCFLSHRHLWSEIAASDRPMLVLEDDVLLSRRLPAVLARLAATPDVDFLNLESFDRRRFVARRCRPVADGVAVRRCYRDKSGSAAYLLWPAGARKLLERTDKRGAAPVDAFLHGFGALRSFQVEPALAVQLHVAERRGLPLPIPAGSSIQAPRTPLSPTLRNAPFFARRAETQLRLAGHHLMRLFGRRYERTAVVDADFVASDQSRS